MATVVDGCDPGDVLPHAQCLRHGLTIHTSCSVVPPFPKSNPLRLLIPDPHPDTSDPDCTERGVRSRNVRKFVLSTGNFIHAFKIEILDPLNANVRSRRQLQQHPLLPGLFSPPSRCWHGASSPWSQGRALTMETP